MKYRQWKKNYKKMHGCNPPIEIDPKKQSRILSKALRCICETDWSQIFKKVADTLEQMVSIAKKMCENQKESLEKNKDE